MKGKKFACHVTEIKITKIVSSVALMSARNYKQHFFLTHWVGIFAIAWNNKQTNTQTDMADRSVQKVLAVQFFKEKKTKPKMIFFRMASLSVKVLFILEPQ